jgi:hypothetical protein
LFLKLCLRWWRRLIIWKDWWWKTRLSSHRNTRSIYDRYLVNAIELCIRLTGSVFCSKDIPQPTYIAFSVGVIYLLGQWVEGFVGVGVVDNLRDGSVFFFWNRMIPATKESVSWATHYWMRGKQGNLQLKRRGTYLMHSSLRTALWAIGPG